MLSPWSGMPADFVLEEYLERYGTVIESRPTRYAGIWAQACHPLTEADAGYREVRLDLGCGKGAFTVQSALQYPDVLFIGIDTDPLSIAFAARLAVESNTHNVVFVPGRDGTLGTCFAPGELAIIYLNFPTPHPKGREAPLRLTSPERLIGYRQLLEEDGLLKLQTDNRPLYAYTLAQLAATGYEVLVSSENAREELPAAPQTAYERRAVEMGASICAITATPGPAPEQIDRTAPTSLYDYLPSDLDDLGYVPPEMTRAVAAIRKTRARAACKADRKLP